MRRYLRIYQTLLQMNFATLVAYRANFVNSLISSIAWATFSVITILLLTARTPRVFGWTKEELLVLTGSYSIVIGVFHLLFSRNFERFSNLIFFGQLDSILIKPVDYQFLLTFWLINYTSIVRVILGILFTLYMLNSIGVNLTLINIIGFFALMVVGIMTVYSIWFLVLTLIIWSPRLANLVHLLFVLTGMARYPAEMYYGLKSYVLFFLLPLILVVTTPTKVILQRALVGEILGLVFFALILSFLSRKFWKFALRYYTSASS